MHFVKMNGAGNDFIVLDNREVKMTVPQLSALARIVCERHLSVGADGLMAVDTAEGAADYKMLFFNSDGSIGEMCGNGARCISRYGYEKKLAGETQTIETTAGIVTGHRIDQRLYKVRLNDPSVIRLEETMNIEGKEYACGYVELGNPGIPHVVVPMPGLENIKEDELRELGRKMRFYKDFPKGANVNFYEIVGEDKVLEKTFERGVEDFTYACGTGTGSLVTVLTLKGLVSGRKVEVRMPGGTLVIDVNLSGKEPEEGKNNCECVKDLYLTGPTNWVCEGELTDEELQAALKNGAL